MTSSSTRVSHGVIVWTGKPWVVPAAIIRTVTVFVVAVLFFWLELYSGVAYNGFAGLPLWSLTLLVFTVIWLLSLLDLVIFYFTNTYVLRQDGLEIRRGIIRLHSFVVTPSGFGDLSLYQGIGGRIFNYGDLTVLSQGERKTKLPLVRSPFAVADTIRDVMGKPIVRVEGHV